MSPEELAPKWREKAAALSVYSPAAAEAFKEAATDLEAALRTASNELLTLDAAAAISGYSSDHLGRQLRRGKIPNVGRRGAPRIQRADLPKKAGRGVASGPHPPYDPATDARSLASRRKGGAHGLSPKA